MERTSKAHLRMILIKKSLEEELESVKLYKVFLQRKEENTENIDLSINALVLAIASLDALLHTDIFKE